MIGIGIRQHLEADAGVAAIAPAVYPHVIPHEGGRTPAIVYRVDTDEAVPTTGGASSFRQARVSLDCYAERYQDAHDLGDAVESALIDYVGQLGSTTPAVDANHIRSARRFDIFETETELYRVSLQIFVGYERV